MIFAGFVFGPSHTISYGLSMELYRWNPRSLWWATIKVFYLLVKSMLTVEDDVISCPNTPADPWFWMLCLSDMRWLRNQVVAPLTEELVFRACMLPMLVPCAGPFTAIFTCPLFFGVGKFGNQLLNCNCLYEYTWPKVCSMTAGQKIANSQLFLIMAL